MCSYGNLTFPLISISLPLLRKVVTEILCKSRKSAPQLLAYRRLYTIACNTSYSGILGEFRRSPATLAFPFRSSCWEKLWPKFCASQEKVHQLNCCHTAACIPLPATPATLAFLLHSLCDRLSRASDPICFHVTLSATATHACCYGACSRHRGALDITLVSAWDGLQLTI